MKFSIVIPTRERADTLQYALRTCTAQQYDDLEIIVSDNASNDDTRAVVAAAAAMDPRVRYVNTGARLSMTGNWEFGLRHVTGDFVNYLGDDDGVLPNAVADVAAIIEATRTKAVGWLKAEYCWPSYPKAGLRNYLSVPMGRELFEYPARRVARDICKLWIPYYRAPVVYNSFISMTLVRACRHDGGPFFRSVVPDVYSGLAVAAHLDSYMYSLRPFSVSGGSGHSIGSSALEALNGNGKDNPVAAFHRENDIPLHPRFPMPYLGSVTAVVIEAALQANDHCYQGSLDIDLRHAVNRVVREVSRGNRRVYDAVTSKLREIAQSNGLRSAIANAERRFPWRGESVDTINGGLGSDLLLAMDASRFGVADVDAASQLVHNIIGDYVMPQRRRGYSWWTKIRSRAARRIVDRVSDRAL